MVSIEVKAETPEELAEAVRALLPSVAEKDAEAMREQAVKVLTDLSRKAWI